MAILKNEIDTDLLIKIINDINSKTKTLTSYESELGINRSSIKRRFKDIGYYYDKDKGMWLLGATEKAPKKATNLKDNTSITSNLKAPTSKAKTDKIKSPIGRPKKIGEYKRFNMELPADLLKALKRKALEEETTATEIIVKYLNENIESKYR